MKSAPPEHLMMGDSRNVGYDPWFPCRLPRGAIAGLLFWTVFCALAVFVRGVRWDEHFEFAEVILERVPYPHDHPIYFWTHHVRNLQLILSTAVVWVFPGPEALCALRNTLFMMAAVLPAYLMAVVLSGRILAGHAAATFILFEVFIAFTSNYRWFAWPYYFSTGHIGRGFALVAFCLFLGGRWRAAFLMLGFLPLVHIGQVPFIALIVLLAALWTVAKGGSRTLARALPWIVPGLLIHFALWSARGYMEAPLPTEGPYYSLEDATPIAKGFMSYDRHRAIPGSTVKYGNSAFMVGAIFVLTMAAARIQWLGERRLGPWFWLCAYMATVAVVIAVTMAIHVQLRHDIPRLLIAWMPYRFANHATLFMVAVIPAILFRESKILVARHGPALLAAALLFVCFKSTLAPVFGQALYGRYLENGEVFVFIFTGFGAAILFLESRNDRPFLWWWSGFAFAALMALATYHQFGAACIAMGFAAVAALHMTPIGKKSAPFLLNRGPRWTVALVLVMGVVLSAKLFGEWRHRSQLPVTPLRQQAAILMETRGDGKAMVVARPYQHGLQGHISHPVLVDTVQASNMAYMPFLAPTIQKLHQEIYGLRFHPPMTNEDPYWTTLWQERSVESWQTLAKRYRFRYVFSPGDVPLKLPRLAAGEFEFFYEIPLAGDDE